MITFSRIISIFLGGFLIILVLIFGILRRSPSTAQWIIFHARVDWNFDIYRMNADGSNMVNLTRSNRVDRFPSWSSDGRSIVYYSGEEGNFESGGIYRMNYDGSDRHLIINTRAMGTPEWSPDGEWIVYSRGYWEDDIRMHKIRVDGTDDTQLTQAGMMDADPHWSADGEWIVYNSYRYVDDVSQRGVFRMRADGSQDTYIDDGVDFWFEREPSLSPDGEWIAFQGETVDGNHIYKMRSDGSDLTRLTDIEDGDAKSPSWSPDGEWIVFTTGVANEMSLRRMRSDGSDMQTIYESESFIGYPNWSPRIDRNWNSHVMSILALALFIPIWWRRRVL